jgi:hypothetical protein
MDKNKVENLAKRFSLSCKQAVKSDQMGNLLASPAVALIAITVIKVMEIDSGIDKLRWGF